MLELSQQEWAILLVAGVIIFGWLLIRAKGKQSRRETAPLVAAMVHRKSILAQMESLDGANIPTMGSPVGTGRFLEDGYVRAAIGMEANRQDFFRQAMDASRTHSQDGTLFTM
jgi:hypothetical protein